MSKSIEERYFEDFGKNDYDMAVHALWEAHCQYGMNGKCPSWPPTLEQIKLEMKSVQEARQWQNDRR